MLLIIIDSNNNMAKSKTDIKKIIFKMVVFKFRFRFRVDNIISLEQISIINNKSNISLMGW